MATPLPTIRTVSTFMGDFPHGAFYLDGRPWVPGNVPTFIGSGRVHVLAFVPTPTGHDGGLRVRAIIDGEVVGGEETWVRA